jgi:hypothetical protein
MDLDSISTGEVHHIYGVIWIADLNIEDTFQTVMGRGQCSKDPEHMRALALAAAGSSDDDERPCPKRKSSRKRKPTPIFSKSSVCFLGNQDLESVRKLVAGTVLNLGQMSHESKTRLQFA